MIVLLSGMVLEVSDESVIVERDGVGYEVLLCGFDLPQFEKLCGKDVTLYTLHYLEGNAAGGNLIPRLIGFLNPRDREFFQIFTTVKGIGARKAMRALVEPVSRVAAAIESDDPVTLSKLPGIGKRGAQQIIAELKGKVTDFALGADTAAPAVARSNGWTPAQHDALEVIVALGERRADAERWLARAIELHPEDRPVDEWIRLALSVRSGAS